MANRIREFLVDRKQRKVERLVTEMVARSDRTHPMTARYNQALAPARREMALAVDSLYAATDGDRIIAFLMYFTMNGYHMTEPVASWIRRAGVACRARGYDQLGDFLVEHASEEAGHEAMMRRDLEALIALYNARRGSSLSGGEFLAQPISAGTRNYISLHEECIAGEHPFQQVAIETEIEYVSLLFGPRFIAFALKAVGLELRKALTFITSHVGFDVQHTRRNFECLGTFLAAHPAAFEPMVAAAERAIACYTEYLIDCHLGALRLEPSNV